MKKNLFNFINIGVWNIQGLFTKVNYLKLNKLEDPEIFKRITSFELLCIQETQCTTKDAQSSQVPGYLVYAFHRKISKNNRYFGGSAILIKKELKE